MVRSTTMHSLACEPTCGGKCSAAQCFACLTNCATASVVTGTHGAIIWKLKEPLE